MTKKKQENLQKYKEASLITLGLWMAFRFLAYLFSTYGTGKIFAVINIFTFTLANAFLVMTILYGLIFFVLYILNLSKNHPKK